MKKDTVAIIILAVLILGVLVASGFFKEIIKTTGFFGYDDQQLLSFQMGDTEIEVSKTYIHGGTLLASKSNDSGKIQYYVQDHLGSNRKVYETKDWGLNIKEENIYYDFGERTSAPDSDNSYLYTGKKLDEETGLYYYGARYYKPELGRFMQPDSNFGDISDPLSLNRYTYVKNNPLKYIDPSGNREIRMWVINAAGRVVADVTGDNAVTWSFTGQASGVYVVGVYDDRDNQIARDKISYHDGMIAGSMFKPNKDGTVSKNWIGPNSLMYEYSLQGKQMDFIIGGPDPGEQDPGENAVKSYSYSENVDLHWTAPGDNGNQGTAARYILAYSTTPIQTKEQFEASSQISSTYVPVPEVAGSQQGVAIPASEIGYGRWFFAIVACDEAGNCGGVSNNVVVEVTPDDEEDGPDDPGGGG